MAKIKLSETIHFFPATDKPQNESQPLQSRLHITIEEGPLTPGGELHAHIHCTLASSDSSTQLDYLTVALEGRITQDDNSTAFVHAAEIAHDHLISAGSEFTQPVAIRIPHEALPTDTNTIWKLAARAVWKNTQIIHDQIEITLVNTPPSYSSRQLLRDVAQT